MTARRSISQTRRARIFAAAAGVCHICGGKIQSGQGWDAEHRIPLALGGADDDSNLAPAHRKCHAGKTKADVSQIAKCERQRLRHIGIKRPPTFRKPAGTRYDWKRGRYVTEQEGGR